MVWQRGCQAPGWAQRDQGAGSNQGGGEGTARTGGAGGPDEFGGLGWGARESRLCPSLARWPGAHRQVTEVQCVTGGSCWAPAGRPAGTGPAQAWRPPGARAGETPTRSVRGSAMSHSCSADMKTAFSGCQGPPSPLSRENDHGPSALAGDVGLSGH